MTRKFLIALWGAVFFPAAASADWPPGPRFTSAGRFVEQTPNPQASRSVLKAPAAPVPMSAGGYDCPDSGVAASWFIGGHASGLDPAVITATPDGPVFDSGHAGEISQAAMDLLPALPGFIVKDFLLRLSQIPVELQEQLAQVLGSLPVNHLDEAAFLVAHLSLEDLLSDDFDPWLLKETPANIYAAGQAGMGLAYSTLVEHTSSDGGVDWTTVRLRMDDGTGQIVEAEAPRDVYYWYVVHPKLDLEPVQLTVPDTGKAAHHPQGAAWREYYMFTPDGLARYTDHFLFRNPAMITGDDLQGWGPSAATVFKDMKVGPLELVRTPTGLAMIEFRIKAGTILATTMPVEKAAAEGSSQILTNCLYYGNGNVHTVASLPH
ncbi:MAG: hypothetical protein GXP54_10375, partial [Deltaproteobacteria bacterium]|nr:hypothetical protein [Deltaproteobacteria bacterium]